MRVVFAARRGRRIEPRGARRQLSRLFVAMFVISGHLCRPVAGSCHLVMSAQPCHGELSRHARPVTSVPTRRHCHLLTFTGVMAFLDEPVRRVGGSCRRLGRGSALTVATRGERGVWWGRAGRRAGWPQWPPPVTAEGRRSNRWYIVMRFVERSLQRARRRSVVVT